jgi:hypothetical protein
MKHAGQEASWTRRHSLSVKATALQQVVAIYMLEVHRLLHSTICHSAVSTTAHLHKAFSA